MNLMVRTIRKFTRPVGKNDPHGLGPSLDAGIEVMRYKESAAQPR
jgi:hypothetical protein